MKMKAIYHSGRKESVFYEQDIKTPFPLRALSCISFQKQNRDAVSYTHLTLPTTPYV